MDIKDLRNMMRGWYSWGYDPRKTNPEDDYDEAARAIRALKSLFERELQDRESRPATAQPGCDDRVD